MFFFLYVIIPIVCVGYGIYSLNKWKKKNAELVLREKLLNAASRSLQENNTSVAQYSIEEIGQGKMEVISRCVPTARILLQGATSVPKYCGSWQICNWQRLTESERAGLHTEYKSYISGKVWHSIDQSFALLTDTGSFFGLSKSNHLSWPEFQFPGSSLESIR